MLDLLFPVQFCFLAMLCFIHQYKGFIAWISCGFMFGSSVFLPSLFTANMNGGGQELIWLTAIIWLVSMVSFASLKRLEIVSNALYTLPWSTIPVLYIVHSPEQSMYHFMSIAPVWISIGLVLSVAFTPKLRRVVRQLRRLIMDTDNFEPSDVSVRTDIGTVDPDSVRSFRLREFHRGPISSREDDGNFTSMGAHLEGPFHPGISHYYDVEMAIDNFDS